MKLGVKVYTCLYYIPSVRASAVVAFKRGVGNRVHTPSEAGIVEEIASLDGYLSRRIKQFKALKIERNILNSFTV